MILEENYDRGGGLVIGGASYSAFNRYTRDGGLYPLGDHNEVTFDPNGGLVVLSGAATTSFTPASPAPSGDGVGEAYSLYPWWRPFFTWPQPRQIELPDFDEIPRRYVSGITSIPIIVMGHATSRFVRGPAPKVMPVVESVVVHPSVLVLPAVPPRIPRQILTEVESLISRLHEQRIREDDELLLVLPKQSE